MNRTIAAEEDHDDLRAKVTKEYKGKLQTVIEDSIFQSCHSQSLWTQYVRDDAF